MGDPQEWLETCRTEYHAASEELRLAKKRLDDHYTAVIQAAERYGAAAVAAGQDPLELGLG
jgi:hypothetical protein